MTLRKLACLSFLAASFASAQSQISASIADRARNLARSGSIAEALKLYQAALAADPQDSALRLDYATVLGWAEHYPESIAQFRRVLSADPEQPEWVYQELARSELFAGHTAEALATLRQITGMGKDSELTLCRAGLALRWLNRAREAEQEYQRAITLYPHSTMAQIGLIYAVADQNQLDRALDLVTKAARRNPDNWEFRKVQGQILNWMGRHREALKILRAIDFVQDRELLESRIAAARWSGNAAEAKRTSAMLAKSYPGIPAVEKLGREVSLEYGRAVESSFRISGDTDGVSDRLYEQGFAIHAGPANRLRIGLEERWISNESDLGWRALNLRWTSELSSRLSLYASAARLTYTAGPQASSMFADAALTVFLNDRARISAGAGNMPMDAFRAVENRVTGRFGYISALLKPSFRTSFEARYSHYAFSDQVLRDRADIEGFYRVHTSRKLKLDAGGSVNWMGHNLPTEDFFSPASFYSVLGKARFSGQLSNRVEYTALIGAGLQREAGFRYQSPLLADVSISARLNQSWCFRIDAGQSASSLERINPGREAYRRRVLSAGLVYRFK